MKNTFAIIGCGLTGTSAFCQFIRILQEKAVRGKGRFSGIRIAIIEKQDRFGPGFPHSNQFVMPCHVTNTCPEDMGILSGKPSDFQDWLEAEYDRLLPQFTAFLDDPAPSAGFCTHYPRTVVGEYLQSRFVESLEAARRLGCDVVLYPRCEALDAVEKKKKVTLFLKESLSLEELSAWRQTTFSLPRGTGSKNRRITDTFHVRGLHGSF